MATRAWRVRHGSGVGFENGGAAKARVRSGVPRLGARTPRPISVNGSLRAVARTSQSPFTRRRDASRRVTLRASGRPTRGRARSHPQSTPCVRGGVGRRPGCARRGALGAGESFASWRSALSLGRRPSLSRASQPALPTGAPSNTGRETSGVPTPGMTDPGGATGSLARPERLNCGISRSFVCHFRVADRITRWHTLSRATPDRCCRHRPVSPRGRRGGRLARLAGRGRQPPAGRPAGRASGAARRRAAG